ncbi:DMT family transporter [Ekhidna sp.]|uniref:DMT family transporter n=1 Tax=Ekhidna sp. TaxID=2608089 RepID=UPI003BA95C9D
MKTKNIYLLILLASLWGPSFLFIKIAVAEVPPVMLAAIRIGIAAIILNLILLLQKRHLPLSLDFWKKTVIAGFFAQGLPFVLINWGEQYVDSSLASVINGLMPLFTIIFAHFMIAEEQITNRKLFGIALGFIGLLVLVMPGFRMSSGGNFLGIMSIILATVSYGIGLTLIRKYFAKTSSIKAPAAQLLSVSIYLIPLAVLLYPNFEITSLSMPAIGSVLMLTVFGTAIAFIIYFKLIEQSSAAYASLVTYLMPIYGVVLGTIFLEEKVSAWMLLGTVLILVGIRVTKKSNSLKRSIAFNIDQALYSKFR